MIRLASAGLRGHVRRLVGLAVAVVVGVAFLSGTLMLSDTLHANFDRLFTDVTAGTDVVVRSATSIEQDRGLPRRGLIDARIVDAVRQVQGVATAEPSILGYGSLIGTSGRPIGGNGPPRLAGSWIEDPALNPYRLVEGRAPGADDEVVINRGAANEGQLTVGSVTTVQTPQPVEVRVVGIATFGDADGFGRATFTAFTLAGAQQHVTAAPGRISTVVVQAAPGVSQTQLRDTIAKVLPAGTEAITGRQLTDESIGQINRVFLDMLSTFLVAFAVIAVLVATLSIHNTFSVIVAQRRRELAMVRTVGASRRQALGSVLLEAGVVGVTAASVGLAAGVGMAELLKGLFDAFGFALPAGGLTLRPAALVVAWVVGVVVTLVAALTPAIAAATVPPLAALRDSAAEPAGGSRRRMVIGAALTAAGTVVLAIGAVIADVALVGAGAVGLLVGAIALGPAVARPAANLLGWPLERWRGVTGALARENVRRSPRRAAGTANALLIGVGVVTLVTVVVASMEASIQQQVGRTFAGDLVVNSPGFGGGALSPALATDVSRLPGVDTAIGLGRHPVRLGADSTTVSIVSDTARVAQVLDLRVVAGSLSNLGAASFAASRPRAESDGWRIGDTVAFTFLDGATTPLRLAAVYDSNEITGGLLLSRAAWSPHALQDADVSVFIRLEPGISVSAGQAAIEPVAEPYGAGAVQTKDQYVASVTEGLDLLLGIVYVMLVLAILIAVMGITNTLSLAVHERRHELGLLRAVGQSRAQARSLVRLEAVVISALGTVGGLVVGTTIAWALAAAIRGASPVSLALPAVRLLVVLVVGALVGMVAAVRPARTAARLPVLDAIAAT